MKFGLALRFITLGVILLVSACSDILDGPTEDDIATQLGFELPTGVQVGSIEIIVSENVGSEVEPKYRNRSKATLRLVEDRVDVVDSFDDRFIIRTVMEGGVDFEVTLITTAVLENEKWKVKFDKFDGRQVTGAPIGQFVEGTYAYEGTEKAAEFLAAYEAKLEAERQAAADAAERQQQEAEAARAQAEADRVARIKEFRQFIAGTWLSKTPVFRNNGIYQSRSGETAGIELSFDDGDDATGKVSVKLFVIDDIMDEIVLNASFRVNDDGKTATLFLTSNATHRTLNWSFRENWTFNKDGIFQTGTRRNRWYVEMEKGGAALTQKRAEEERLVKRGEAIAALRAKHRAFSGENRLRDIGLNQNTFGPVFVDAEKAKKGDVFGDSEEYYGENSSIISAAIHAGILSEGESAVLKVSRRYLKQRYNINGTLKNGIQSKTFNNYDVYQIELMEKLVVD